MQFERVRPSGELSAHVEWFWGMRSSARKPEQQKIVPDGFPEVIFHFGDPYRIQLDRRWRRQARALLGGQLKHHFFLENTGRTDMFGITFRPAALTHLFDLNMGDYAGRVVALRQVHGPWAQLVAKLSAHTGFSDRVSATENWLRARTGQIPAHPIDSCLEILFRDHGTTTIQQLCQEAGVTERQLQRYFQHYIGVSPKFYARTIRFSYLFSLIQGGQTSWSDVVFLSGYYDQSHFIRDFKAFTGEDPTRFQYREETMTGFFTHKKGSRMSGLSNP